ncbi:DUF3526 domain-containing protein [Tenacibaculum ovolyticum]|uniref:DUF3526 domain-containing protein n=1 Tax=Tenacibaculum ovolyticum TaxID=104270 RepID=UPI0003FFCD5C|nr:DUF3526 domain-containing protein [Tenacibaculum ovolyticum]
MILYIIKKELREIYRDGRFKISIGIVLALLVTAILVTTNQYKTTINQYNKAKNNERSVWESQGEKNPHSAAHYGNYVFKPKSPLSLIDQGVDKYTGVSIFLEAHSRNEALFSDATDQTTLSRFGELTPNFILLYILPLIIILIGYNTFTKEIEGNTFYILKSQGITGWKLLLGKWIATLIPAMVITTLLFVFGGIIFSNIKDYGVLNWKAFGMLYLIYLIYYLVFTNIVLLISSLVKKSGVALVTSLFFWISACFITPKLASNIADTKYPYPTHQEFSEKVYQEYKKGLDGHSPWSKQAKKLEKEILEKYNVDSVHKLPFNFSAYRMQKGEEQQAEIYAKHYGLLKQIAIKQNNVYKTLAMISPFLPTRFLSMSVAKTDYQYHWNFSEAAEKYRVETQRFLNGTTEKNSKYRERYIAPANTWAKLPKFKYEAPSFSETFKENSSLLLILSLWFAITATVLIFTNKTY